VREQTTAHHERRAFTPAVLSRIDEMTNKTLALYERMRRWPAGHWLFTRAICFKAPYFASISPKIEALQPGRCEVSLRHRRKITNHIGTVHAIALCNMAELAGGMMTEVSLPGSMRWIPQGMTVEYVKKAVGTMRAVATPAIPIVESNEAYALPVHVIVTDPKGDTVFSATISMWLSPKRSS
jgi:acyl-coenzyme A thioesterase PaaI-like protein